VASQTGFSMLRRSLSGQTESAEFTPSMGTVPRWPSVLQQHVRFWLPIASAGMTDMLKGFGCLKAYESLSCRNPRATGDDYGDFELRLMSAMA